MPSYGELFMHDYGIVQETTLGKGLKELLSADASRGDGHLKTANRLYREKKYKEAAKEYKEAKKYYIKVQKNAEKIDDDMLWEHVVRIFFTPPVIYLMQLSMSDFKGKSFTRSSTISYMTKFINRADDRIKECEQMSRTRR